MKKGVCFKCKMLDVSNWVNATEKVVSEPIHETVSLALERVLEVASVTAHPPFLVRCYNSSFGLVAEPTEHVKRCRPSPKGTQLRGVRVLI